MLRSQTEFGMNIQRINDVAMNAVENLCSIVTMPVEIIIRPQYGTRYFPVPVVFFAVFMMIILPALSALFTGVQQMIPFSSYRAPLGLFGIGSLAKLYFALSVVHSVRLYRRMLDMSSEVCSEYEGPPLPFFRLLPKSRSFWFTRIVWEPAFIFATATILERILIFQSGLGTYLQITALMLAMKNAIAWFKNWEYLRKLMDARFAGPIIAKLVENRATEDDLATVHLASFPTNLSPDIRQAAVSHIARAFSPESEGTAHTPTAQ